MHRDLGTRAKVLSDQLGRLVEQGILATHTYSRRPPRHESLLTHRGRELVDVLLVMMPWRDRWTAGTAGLPLLLRHACCGLTHAEVHCAHYSRPLRADMRALLLVQSVSELDSRGTLESTAFVEEQRSRPVGLLVVQRGRLVSSVKKIASRRRA